MSGNNNKKYLFRQPALDPERDQYEHLPKDIAEWLDPYATSGRGAGAQGGNAGAGFVSGDVGSDSDFPEYIPPTTVFVPYNPEVPGTTAKQPEIISVIRQEVKQDPQGGATITVTLAIGPEQDNMEYELRLTKKP
jgi:hypothetical protein